MSRGLLEAERWGWNPSSVTSSKLPNLAAAEPIKWGRNAHLEGLLCQVPRTLPGPWETVNMHYYRNQNTVRILEQVAGT